MSKILVTGAAGAVGQALLPALTARPDHAVVATDLRRPAEMPKGAAFETLDVVGDDPDRVIGAEKPDVVVHLASIVTPPKGSTRDFAYRVDVTGTQNVVKACVDHGVRRLIVTSSGAAYGYHADNPVPLSETDAIRGNEAFAYSHHKRLIEKHLAETRRAHPALEQVVLRVGTILGPAMDNQITALFKRPKVLALKGSESPFVFIDIEDLAAILLRAATDGPPGIYNVAGDGWLGATELAEIMGKQVRRISPTLMRLALGALHPLGLTPYGPEQVLFLQYRPVLDNARLKSEFGYAPRLASRAVFEKWWRETEHV